MDPLTVSEGSGFGCAGTLEATHSHPGFPIRIDLASAIATSNQLTTPADRLATTPSLLSPFDIQGLRRPIHWVHEDTC